MRTHSLALAVAGLMACGGPASTGETGPAKPAESRRIEPAANGLRLPADYRNWPLIAVSRRNDKDSLRAIVGNPVAVRAARQGTTAPWPDGTILAKIVWKDAPLASWEAALVPTELVHVEIMVKDSSRFGEHGGWGFARWVGNELAPHSSDASAVQACFACHEPVADQDYVFTRPALLP